MACIQDLLLSWYQKNKRDLPWRETSNPYYIWVSEVILQQTRVDQGLAYYKRFITHFPNVQKLASAPLEQVLFLWKGLGYYSRARNMHHAAQYISNHYNGNFPNTYKDILELKGVGPYTAAAIASIACNLPYAVIDGNVQRVYARLFSVKQAVDSHEGINIMKVLAEENLYREKPGDYNQAVMEFGATVCTPKNPDCANCILNDTCLAFSENTVEILPLKSKKVIVKERYFHFLVLHYQNKTWIEKREAKDIWKELYQFPLIETPSLYDPSDLVKSSTVEQLIEQQKGAVTDISDLVVHKLTHQTLKARFYHMELSNDIVDVPKNWIATEDINQFPIPRLIEQYWHNYQNRR